MATATSAPAASRTAARTDLLALGGLTVLLRLPAYLADRHLTFDDGVFGASAIAMRHGGVPFRDVFSSQGPLWLPLVWIGDLLGLRTANAPRVTALASALLLVAATYLAGRVVADRTGAVLAGGLVSVTASSLWITGPLAADGFALAFATTTMWLALRWRDEIDLRRAVVLGLGICATVSVKALLAPIILPVALVLLATRQVRLVLAAAATAVVGHLLLWLPWGPANVWEQSYEYHLEVAGERTPGANLAKVLATLGDRDLLVVVALALAVGAVLLHRRASPPAAEPRLTSPDTLLLTWLAGTALVLLTEHPLWRPHVSQLVPAMALLAARHRPPLRVLIVAAVLVVPYHVVHAWPILHPSGYAESTQQILPVLRGLPDGALIISDDPGVVWRAGRRTTDDLVDASILRIEGGELTAESVARAAADPRVCAVAVRSSTRWGSFDELPDLLAAEGYRIAVEDDLGRRLYVKEDCDPG